MKSIASLSEDLGVTPAIIRSWQINLNIEHPRYQPEEPVYDVHWQRFFEDVARLRKQGHSFGKIRTILASTMPDQHSLPVPGKAPAKGNGNGNGASKSKAADEAVLNDAEVPGQLNFSFNSRDPRSYNPAEESSQALVKLGSDSNLPALQGLQRNMHEALIHQDLTKMAQTYVQLMENYQTLASKYTESAYAMGQMEEKTKSLETLLHEKENHFQDKEQAQIKRIQELESHLDHLRQSLNQREADLNQSQEQLVTKDEISQVEKQLKLLAVTVFQQQELAKNQQSGFWSKLKQKLFKD